MNEKIHQANKSEYQVRIDGKPVYFNGCISSHTFDKYHELCRENPYCYVDIVRVSKDIICSKPIIMSQWRHRMSEITDKEILDFVREYITFGRDLQGILQIKEVNCSIHGDVKGNTGSICGNVYGDVRGNVIWDVKGDIGGDVFGDVDGDVRGDVYGTVHG